VTGGTNCSDTSTTCSMGVCTNCTDQRAAASGARLLYVYPYYYYVYVKNKGGCTINAYNLYVQNSYRSSSTATIYTSSDYNYSSLAPGSTGYLYPYMNYSTSGSNLVLLCYQDCSSTANIIDVVQLGTGISPPSGVTFANPLTNGGSSYYYGRTAYVGVYPSFLGSDWTYQNSGY
jgi:hypothetical protein